MIGGSEEIPSSVTVSKATPNPYVHRIHQYPGRIFCVQTGEHGVSELQERAASSRVKIVEFGSGSGQHLIGLGERFPEADCFGLELRYKRTVRTIEKATQAGVENVYVAHADARRAEELFGRESVSAIYVNFPDPWAKKRQAKHRVLAPWLLDVASRLLRPGGALAVKTDHEDSFDRFLGFLGEAPQFAVEWTTRDLDRSPQRETNISTEFEGLFRSQGLPIFGVRARLRT